MADVRLIYSYDCNGTPAQDWDVVNGKTQIRVHGTNFCLDAGNSAFRIPVDRSFLTLYVYRPP